MQTAVAVYSVQTMLGTEVHTFGACTPHSTRHTNSRSMQHYL